MTLFLFFAALVGGALNSVAGGGSFIALPALMFAGVTPVAANATTTFAMWPGSAASALAYRGHMTAPARTIAILGAVSLVGGLLGGLLLVRTSDTSFMRLLPWLMLAAAATFTFGGPVQERLRRRRVGRFSSSGTEHRAPGTEHPAPSTRHAAPGLSVWALLLQLVIAIYGGYFGGGMGIVMLATFSVAGMTDIHEMNALKSILAVIINGVALAEFVAYGVIEWGPGLVMVAGGIAGGYAGASIARRINPRHVRVFVVAVGWIMTAYFFIRGGSGN